MDEIRKLIIRAVVPVALVLAILSCAEESVDRGEKDYRLGARSFIDIEYNDGIIPELEQVGMGGLSVRARLIDEKYVYWPFRIYQDGLGEVRRTPPTEYGYKRLAPGIYDVSFEQVEIVYPQMRGILVKTGRVITVTMNLSARVVFKAERQRSIRIYDSDGLDISRETHDIGAGEQRLLNLLPGIYRIGYVFGNEYKEDIMLDLKRWEPQEIQL